jgi:hypothetical protein
VVRHRQNLFAPPIAQAWLMPDRVIYGEAEDEKSVLWFGEVSGMADSALLSPRSRGSLILHGPVENAINSPLACSAFAS